jgi:hypothetical protein
MCRPPISHRCRECSKLELVGEEAKIPHVAVGDFWLGAADHNDKSSRFLRPHRPDLNPSGKASHFLRYLLDRLFMERIAYISNSPNGFLSITGQDLWNMFLSMRVGAATRVDTATQAEKPFKSRLSLIPDHNCPTD